MLNFFDFGHLQEEKRGQKAGPKVLTLGPPLFHKYSNPSKISQIMFLFARVLPQVRISAILDHLEEVRAQKPPKKGYFVDAELVLKMLETFNLTTTNAILMKLTTIMYLHDSVNRKALRARNSFFFFWLNSIASMVKL